MEIAKKAMKWQFDKERRNPQGLKAEDNMWLEAKNIHSNRPSKKLNQKKYGPFRISKNIDQETFQLDLLEEWMIYNVFNEDLLTQCKKPQFKDQHMKPVPPLDIINKNKKYEVKEIRKYWKQQHETQFLVHWKEYRDEHDQWIAETGLPHAKEVIKDYWSRISGQNL